MRGRRPLASIRRNARLEAATMNGNTPPRAGLRDFLDSKFGFWLTTTLLIAAWSSAYAAVGRYLQKEEAERQRAAEAARRDMDAVLKVVPLLFATDGGQQDLGVKLLLSLRNKKAIEEDSLTLVQAVLDERLKAGSGADASEADRRQAALILKAEDSERRAAITRTVAAASAPPVEVTPAPRQLSDAALPLRVYLQIGDEADRSTAQKLRAALTDARLIAPGIELVDARRTPARSDLRYCPDKLDPDALERIESALRAAALSVERKPLAASLCNRVRYNHAEVWLQRGAGAAG
jgi:hypothetical protein